MSRSLSVISVNEGRAAGSADQHSSISDFHPESQCFGIAGLNVLFTIPPSRKLRKGRCLIIKVFEVQQLKR